MRPPWPPLRRKPFARCAILELKKFPVHRRGDFFCPLAPVEMLRYGAVGGLAAGVEFAASGAYSSVLFPAGRTP